MNSANHPGTWIPLDTGEALARRNNVYDRLRPIFEFEPGPVSPPPAPRHISKPKSTTRKAGGAMLKSGKCGAVAYEEAIQHGGSNEVALTWWL
jgi:hypothetical protein